MKIWRLRLDTGKREDSQQYQLINCDDEFSEDFDSRINSPERQLGKLRELEVHVISGRKEFDVSYLWDGLSLFLLNERAKNILEPVLSEYVEFIPVIYKKTLYLMHILCIADVLDLDNIIASKYEGQIWDIKKFVFKKEKIPKSLIFEVLCEGELYEGEVFVKDEFKKIIEENGLTGFSFEEVGEYQ